MPGAELPQIFAAAVSSRFRGFLSADQRGRTLRGVSDDGRAVVYERIQLFGGLGQHPGGFGQPQDAVSDSLGVTIRPLSTFRRFSRMSVLQ